MKLLYRVGPLPWERRSLAIVESVNAGIEFRGAIITAANYYLLPPRGGALYRAKKR